MKSQLNNENTFFFIPYCSFFKDPNKCPQSKNLLTCYGLAYELNRKFKDVNLEEIFDIKHIAVASPCHRSNSLKTSGFMKNLLFPNYESVPSHLRKYMITDEFENACFINTRHPKITEDDLKSGYLIIRIDISHLSSQKLYFTVLHELMHGRDLFHPEERDRYGKLWDNFRLDIEKFQIWKHRVYFSIALLSLIGPLALNSFINSKTLLIALKSFLGIVLFLIYLFFSLFDYVNVLHDLEIDKKAVKVARENKYDLTFYEERKVLKNTFKRIIWIFIVIVVLSFFWLIADPTKSPPNGFPLVTF